MMGKMDCSGAIWSYEENPTRITLGLCHQDVLQSRLRRISSSRSEGLESDCI